MGLTVADVASIPAFSTLSAETLELIRPAVLERTFPRGEIIFLEGDRSRGLWFLRKGRVKIFRVSADGREQGLCLMREGMCCGCPLFFGAVNPASAQALESATLYLIQGRAVLDLADRSPEICRALFGVFARGERVLSSLVVSLSCSNLVGRLASVLLDHADREDPRSEGGSRPFLTLSHEELACLVGTSREVVTRSLDGLRKQGVIELARKRIVILDFPRLDAMARPPAGPPA